MIPTLILLGLILGRWWRLSLIVAAVGWPLVLVASNVMNVDVGLLGASGLAVLNTGVGVLAHQGTLHVARLLRRHQASTLIR